MHIRTGSFPKGRVISRLIGRVERSRGSGLAEGDLVLGFGHWQESDLLGGGDLRLLKPVAPLPAYLGVIGHSGYTAKLTIGILDPQPGQILTVSSAAGMVGSLAGQLAKIAGARVVGIAGGVKAQAVVERFGFDAGVDHNVRYLAAALAAAVPNGIDRHFENVGVKTLDPVLRLVNDHARIALCGLIAHYSDDAPVSLANFRNLLLRAVTLQAFRIADHLDHSEAGLARIEQLVISNRLRWFESISQSLTSLPFAFTAMLNRDGFGKHIVQLPE